MTTQSDQLAPGFGQRLRQERKRLRLTQAEFAEAIGEAGVQTSFVRLVPNGET